MPLTATDPDADPDGAPPSATDTAVPRPQLLGGSSPGAGGRCGDLEATVAALAGEAELLGGSADPRWLAWAAVRLAAAVGPWAQQVGPPPAERTYLPLLRSAEVEAWLIYWPTGGRLQLHDHGGAAGALRVIEGELREQYVDGHRGVAERWLAASQGIAFGRNYVHDVANHTGTGATSVHVYAPPTASMSFYRLSGGGRLERVGEAPGEP